MGSLSEEKRKNPSERGGTQGDMQGRIPLKATSAHKKRGMRQSVKKRRKTKG